jgi:AcrR family transcriptional regulator
MTVQSQHSKEKQRFMPKETFFNLPQEKREHITKIAIEEFGSYEFPEVSISRIVARAGIAKGSFYQYFEDKEDLFEYLLDLLVQIKWETFSLDHPDPQHIGVFRYLRWMAEAGVQFELEHPEIMQVAYRALSRNRYPQRFQTRIQEEAIAFYKRLVVQGKEQGDIAPEIDDDLGAFVFDSIFSALGQFVGRFIVERKDQWPDDLVLFEQPEIVRLFDQTMNILEQGLGTSQRVRRRETELEIAV